jgi:TPR repeat protein
MEMDVPADPLSKSDVDSSRVEVDSSRVEGAFSTCTSKSEYLSPIAKSLLNLWFLQGLRSFRNESIDIESLGKKNSEIIVDALVSYWKSTPPSVLENVHPCCYPKSALVTSSGSDGHPTQRSIPFLVFVNGLQYGDPYCQLTFDNPNADTRPECMNDLAWLQAAAEFYISHAKAHPYYAFKSACCLLFGKGVSQDVLLGANHLWKAILGGHSAAQCILAEIIGNNPECCRRCCDPSFISKFASFASICFKQSVYQRYVPAQNAYGFQLQEQKKFSEAVKYFRQSAEQGDAIGQDHYGMYLRDGLGIPKNLGLAAHFFKLAADQGHVGGQCNYGACLKNGMGIPIDLGLAAHYFKLGADQNDADCQYNYGVCLEKGIGVPIDRKAAAHYYQLSADQGHAAAQYDYGDCLMFGDGINKNLEEAFRYFKQAADQGHVAAQCRCGDCFMFGINKNPREAIRYYKQAADQGHVVAQFNYGQLLMDGKYIDRNLIEAAYYLRLSADQGDADAQNSYGICLRDGLGVEKNISAAASYFKQSADQGHARGQVNYGDCLRQSAGSFCPSSPVSTPFVHHRPSTHFVHHRPSPLILSRVHEFPTLHDVLRLHESRVDMPIANASTSTEPDMP